MRAERTEELAIRSSEIGGPGVYFVEVGEGKEVRRLNLEILK
jgi:hypothetical protein